MNEDILKLTQNPKIETITVEGQTITYRSYRNIIYCTHPLDDIQKMNIFVPEAYFHNESVGIYNKDTAPVFIPNTVGGYMPGPVDEPGFDSHNNQINSLALALQHGYIAVSIGVRGRTTGKVAKEFFEGSKEGALGTATGRKTGRAPAFIVDYKAGIRYLRHNADQLHGNYDRIITNGTSAGGALSALAGASGNSDEYDKYLRLIGAADERDDIYGASCYCPIHNLEHADMAYEWLFAGHNDYHRTKHQRTDTGIIRVPDEGMMTKEQIALSEPLKRLFPAYVNSLNLKDQSGQALSLDADGEGSFKDYVKSYVLKSAQKEHRTHDTAKNRSKWMVAHSDIEEQDYLVYENDEVVDFSFADYVTKITRMKQTPAFDSIDGKSPENEEFGDEHCDSRHFTQFSFEHSTLPQKQLADKQIINIMNPTYFIQNEQTDVAPHWRIRHGAFDRDTAIAIPVILATLLQNRNIDVDFFLPWGLPHSGDYDLEELFAWIDEIV